jgi:N-methylhydantoinase A
VAALGSSDAAAAVVERRRAWVDASSAFQEVPGYSFDRLAPGNEVAGPAIVWTPITTLVLGADHLARMDAHRNLVVARRGR